MKMTEITKKSDHELDDLITQTRLDLAKAAIDSRTKEVKDVKLIGRLKQTLARSLTIALERAITNQEQTQ